MAIEDKLTHDERLRLECIGQAVQANARLSGQPSSPEKIISDAKEFSKYIWGPGGFSGEALLGLATTDEMVTELVARLRDNLAAMEKLTAIRVVLTPSELRYRTVDS
jgi:hypothetical protein